MYKRQAHNSTRFVAVGETGTVLTSTDGVSWEQEDSGTTLRFNDVAWVGDSFIATSVGGGVYSSFDGEIWSGGQVAALRTSFNAACGDYPLVVGRNSAIMVSCDTSPDTDGDGAGDLCDPCPSDPDDDCDESESTSSIIGPDGGSVSNAGGSAEVQFPAGVVGEDTAISITSFDPGTADAGFFVGDGLVPAGSVYDFQPEMNFTGDVSITLRYEQMAMPECGPEELDLDVYWWDGIDWVPQGAAQDCVANSLTVLTDHFSFYLVGHPDSDGDGIPDARDQCAGSILEDTVVIDGCDSGIDNMIFENGCSVADMVDGCADGAASHGRFVRCVAHLGNTLKKLGLISGREEGRLTQCAAGADIP